MQRTMQTDVCLVYCCMRVQKGKYEEKETKEAHPAGAGRAEGSPLLHQELGGSNRHLHHKRLGKDPVVLPVTKHRDSHFQHYLRVVRKPRYLI